MKLGFFFIVLCFSIAIISYMTYNINEYLGNSLELREINYSNKKCHSINIQTTLNHMIPFNNKYLISSEYNSLEIYDFKSYLNNKINNEHIYLVNILTEKFSKVKIVDFPKDVPFHPHGLSLYKKSEQDYILYILNHAVNYIYEGEERIEIININYNPHKEEELYFIYDTSIILPKEYFLKIDSISVINENIFYFTTNSPSSSPRDSDELSDIKKYIYYIGYDYLKHFFTILNIKKCFVYIYNKKNVGNEINVVPNSESLLNKGIAYDKKRNLLYVVKAMEKKLNIFEIIENNEYRTKFIKSIPILYVGNNIYYDENKDLIYIGINGKMNDYESIVNAYKRNNNFDEIKIFSGYEIIDPNNNYSINELMLMNNEFKWVTSSIQINGKNYMNSIFTGGIYVCE